MILEELLEHAKQIVSLYNILVDRGEYDEKSLEVHSILFDFDDGKGIQLVSRVLIKNQKDNISDFLYDLVGTSEEALESCYNYLLDDLKTKKPEDYRKFLLTFN